MPPKRILIVDDEPAITQALAALLRQAGYLVSTAHSGCDALAQLTGGPDLIVLDIMLPDLDGYAVCRAVRERPSYVPIIMLTSKDAREIAPQGWSWEPTPISPSHLSPASCWLR